jgi:hypothetical protein
MRILVCGGRDYLDTQHIHRTLDRVHAKHGITLLIEGGARGADARARAWAINRRIPFVTVEADWDAYGLAAGHIRNTRMLDEHQPEAVVAFPGGRGTADMVKQAQQAGVPVWRVPPP